MKRCWKLWIKRRQKILNDNTSKVHHANIIWPFEMSWMSPSLMPRFHHENINLTHSFTTYISVLSFLESLKFYWASVESETCIKLFFGCGVWLTNFFGVGLAVVWVSDIEHPVCDLKKINFDVLLCWNLRYLFYLSSQKFEYFISWA